MDTEFIVIIFIFVFSFCVLILQVIDRIHMIRIEDKIDELNEEIKVIKNKKIKL